MAMPTDWKARADDYGRLLILVDGERRPWKLLRGSDSPVVVDMTDQLAEGEPLTDPVLTLWLLRSQGEQADDDKTADSLGQVTPQGNVLVANLHDLLPGRYYALHILHGDLDNRRGSALLVHSVE